MRQACLEAVTSFYADSDDVKVQGAVLQDGADATLDISAVRVPDGNDDRTVPVGADISVYRRHAAPEGGSCDVSQ